MSWARFDDACDSHPKFLALGVGAKGDARRWMWARVIFFTNRNGSAEVPWNLDDSVPRANRRFLEDCVAQGLLDVEDGRLVVHDWPLYADVTVAEKVAYLLAKDPEMSANEIARQVGGKREIALAEIRRQRGDDSGEPPDPVPSPVPGNRPSGSPGGSRGRASRPDPTLEDQNPQNTDPSPSAPGLSLVPFTGELVEATLAEWRQVYDHWRQARAKTHGSYERPTAKRIKVINGRLARFTAADLKLAIDGVACDPWVDRPQHDDLLVIFKSDEQVEKFLELQARRPSRTPGFVNPQELLNEAIQEVHGDRAAS